jgi:hypothetical protein
MPKARRRTLSHNELESFLTEISSVTNDMNKSVDLFFNIEELEDPVVSLKKQQQIQPPVVKGDADLIREYCRVRYF